MKIIKVFDEGQLTDEYYQWNNIATKILREAADGVWSATTLINLLNNKCGFDIEYKDDGFWVTHIIFPDDKKYFEFLMRAR
jgi:hypothetical protein